MASTLEGAQLSFRCKILRIPADVWKKQIGQKTIRQQDLASPVISAPSMDDPSRLFPVRDLALREIIRHANKGRVTAHVPLLRAEKKFGPLSIVIPEDTTAIVEIVVDDGNILFSDSGGTLSPPIPLPLGLVFQRLYIDNVGDLIVDIESFPNVNLSWLSLGGLRVPGTLDALLDLVYPDEAMASSPTSADSTYIDWSKLLVKCEGVSPQATPLSLGDLGSLSLSTATTLNVTVQSSSVSISGLAEILDGHLESEALNIQDIRGRGETALDILTKEDTQALILELEVEHGEVGLCELKQSNGTCLTLHQTRLTHGSLNIESRTDSRTFVDAWAFGAQELQTKVATGQIVLQIGESPHTLHINSFSFRGKAEQSSKHFLLDGDVSDAALSMSELFLDLGIAWVSLRNVKASGAGRVHSSTRTGGAFSGHWAISADIAEGELRIGDFKAGIQSPTRISLEVTEFSFCDNQVDLLSARGQMELTLKSGRIPLGRQGELHFSRGGTAKVHLQNIRLTDEGPFPQIEGYFHAMAQADPASFERLMEIPAGTAKVTTKQFRVSNQGHIELEDLHAWLESDTK